MKNNIFGVDIDLQAVEVRHLDVQNHHIHRIPIQELQRLRSASCAERLYLAQVEPFHQGLQEFLLVIHQQYAKGVHFKGPYPAWSLFPGNVSGLWSWPCGFSDHARISFQRHGPASPEALQGILVSAGNQKPPVSSPQYSFPQKHVLSATAPLPGGESFSSPAGSRCRPSGACGYRSGPRRRASASVFPALPGRCPLRRWSPAAVVRRNRAAGRAGGCARAARRRRWRRAAAVQRFPRLSSLM